MYKASLFIDGAAIDSTSTPRIEVLNPATEEVLGTAPAAGPAEIEAAIAAAQRALEVWKRTTAWERSNALRRIAALLRERMEEICSILTQEIGKPRAESRIEVGGAAEYFEWCAEEARRLCTTIRDGRAPGSRFDVSHEPVGVVLALTAWNYPVTLACRKLAAALAAGCSVILLPAREVPGVVTAIVRCCLDAGLPKGTVNLLLGSPEDIVAPLMASPVVRKVSFTGSTRVGQILIRQSATTVKRLTMELGGHAPFIVLADADLDKAAGAAALGRFRNAGQVCTAPSRFYVHESVARAFTDKMKQLAAAVRVGNGMDDSVTMGPLATSRQRERAERMVADANDKGARVAHGGSRPKAFSRGYFFEPTVLTDVPQAASVLTEEPFTPIAAIIPYANVSEAIAQSNTLEYGLAAYVFGRSNDAINEVTGGLEAGVIGVNNVAVAIAEMPFGGVKQTGYGREGGENCLLDYLNIKFVHRMPG